MEVIEHQNQRLPGGKALDQFTHRPVCVEAFRRGRRLVASRIEQAQRGEHAGQLAEVLRGQAVELARIERFEVLVEGVDKQTEGKLALELGGAAAQSKAAAPLGLTNELEQQASLANAGLAGDEDEAWIARARLLEQLPEKLQLAVSANEGLIYFPPVMTFLIAAMSCAGALSFVR